MKAAIGGPLPFIVFLLASVIMGEPDGGQKPLVEQIGVFIGVLFVMIICGSFYVVPIGMVSGWIAHRLAFETTVPVSRLAIAIAWVANLSLWGWWVVVAISSS